MDSQGIPRDARANSPSHVPSGNATNVGGEVRAQGVTIPHVPFFPGFSHHGGQMPFLFPHAFMPPLQGVGGTPPVQGTITGHPEFAACSQRPTSQECAIDESKSTKKPRVVRKKPEIVELDNVKDEVDVVKSAGPWKDHWVIQLISIRGEMHSIFSAPPKQGDDCELPFFFLFFSSPRFTLPTFHLNANVSCKV